jgi:hypothetical protein
LSCWTMSSILSSIFLLLPLTVRLWTNTVTPSRVPSTFQYLNTSLVFGRYQKKFQFKIEYHLSNGVCQ